MLERLDPAIKREKTVQDLIQPKMVLILTQQKTCCYGYKNAVLEQFLNSLCLRSQTLLSNAFKTCISAL